MWGPTLPAPVRAHSAPLTLGATRTVRDEGAVCPADRVADVAGIYVRAVGVDLVLQCAVIPSRLDQHAPSIPIIAHIITAGDRAGQSHLAPPSLQDLQVL